VAGLAFLVVALSGWGSLVGPSREQETRIGSLFILSTLLLFARVVYLPLELRIIYG